MKSTARARNAHTPSQATAALSLGRAYPRELRYIIMLFAVRDMAPHCGMIP